MSFPATTYTENESAGAALVSKAATAGLDLTGLQPVAQLQSAVANLIDSASGLQQQQQIPSHTRQYAPTT